MSLDLQERPALLELGVELSNYWFPKAIRFLLPSFRCSVGTQLYGYKCKLCSIHRAFLNTDSKQPSSAGIGIKWSAGKRDL